MDIREHFDYPAAMKQLINYYYERKHTIKYDCWFD